MVGGEQFPSLGLRTPKALDQFLFGGVHGSIGMRGGEKKNVFPDLTHVVNFAFDGPMGGEKDERVQGDDADRHVWPAAAMHVFVVQGNDHRGASTTTRFVTFYRHFGSEPRNQTCTSLQFPLSVTPVTPPTHLREAHRRNSGRFVPTR